MEYRGYTPDEVKKDKRKNLAGIIALVFPTLLGLFMLVGGVAGIIGIQVEDVSEISYMTMETGEEYYFDKLILVDAYTCVGNDITGYKAEDYIVYFTDKDGEVVYTSLRPDDYSDLADKCEAYINDSNQSVGDVVLTGCFHGYDNGSTVRGYLEEAYDTYNVQLPGELLDWTFYFDDVETMDDYRQRESSRQRMFFAFAGVFLLPSTIGILVLIRKRKELDRYIAEYNNEPYNL